MRRKSTLKRPKLTPRELNKAYRLNKVFDLRMQGLSQREIAKKVGVSQGQVCKDLKTLMRSVKPETAALLKMRPTKEKTDPLERAYKQKWLEFSRKNPEQINTELKRIETQIEEITESMKTASERERKTLITKRNLLIMEKHALENLLKRA